MFNLFTTITLIFYRLLVRVSLRIMESSLLEEASHPTILSLHGKSQLLRSISLDWIHRILLWLAITLRYASALSVSPSISLSPYLSISLSTLLSIHLFTLFCSFTLIIFSHTMYHTKILQYYVFRDAVTRISPYLL